ncbi:MAG: sulfotransferase [bacterium]|nr:sulfotransferase [bacterium]
MTSTVREFFRRIRYGEPIVVVSGLPRSGTSMTMKMLEAAGKPLIMDGVRAADEDNPKGYFEDERVKDLNREQDRQWLRESRGKVIKIISFLLPDLPESNRYKVLFMRRNIDEVLASQAKMLARRGETSETSDERMKELYEDHLRKVTHLIAHRPELETIDVQYKSVLKDPRGEAERIRRFLGEDLDVEKMVGAVDEKLYRNRR